MDDKTDSVTNEVCVGAEHCLPLERIGEADFALSKKRKVRHMNEEGIKDVSIKQK